MVDDGEGLRGGGCLLLLFAPTASAMAEGAPRLRSSPAGSTAVSLGKEIFVGDFNNKGR
jgi:hypothetical protein